MTEAQALRQVANAARIEFGVEGGGSKWGVVQSTGEQAARAGGPL